MPIMKYIGKLFVLTFLYLAFSQSVQAQTSKWTITPLPAKSGVMQYVSDLVFLDPNTGYFLNSNHSLFRTTNGGTSWQEIPLPTSIINIQQLQVFPGNELFAMEYNDTFYRFTVLYSPNGGESWERRAAIIDTMNIPQLYAFTSTRGVISPYLTSSEVTMYQTTDGFKTVTSLPVHSLLHSVIAEDEDKLSHAKTLWLDSQHVIVTPNGIGSKIFPVFSSENGGASWDTLSLSHSGSPLNGSFPYMLQGTPTVIVQSRHRKEFQHAMITTDYGKTWKQTTNFNGKINRYAVASQNSIWGGATRKTDDGYNPADLLIHSVDDGITWEVDSITANPYDILGLRFNRNAFGYGFGITKDTKDSSYYLFKYAPLNSIPSVKKEEESPLSTWANPTKDIVHVKYNSVLISKKFTFVKIEDLFGKQYDVPYTMASAREFTLDLRTLAPATYIATFTLSDGSIVHARLVKIK